jgi:hypothetical protein
MAYRLPEDTKFASIHFDGFSAADLPESIPLGGDWSAHTTPIIQLSDFDNRQLGEQRAKAFQEANFALLAARPSTLPTVRDEEWKELEQQVFRLFYSILMVGVPAWSTATLAVGGRDAEGPVFVGHVKFLWYFRHPHAFKYRLTLGDLEQAARIANSLQHVLPIKGEFLRFKRGIYRLSRGWREDGYLADRLHEFVRALDGLMTLSAGRGEADFVARTATFARSPRVADIAREIYRLRSFSEHLADWPSDLGYVKVADRDRFVSERAFQAELIASAAYRSVLSDPVLRESFRDETGIAAFWAGETGRPLAGAVDLEARSSEYEFGLDW